MPYTNAGIFIQGWITLLCCRTDHRNMGGGGSSRLFQVIGKRKETVQQY